MTYYIPLVSISDEPSGASVKKVDLIEGTDPAGASFFIVEEPEDERIERGIHTGPE